MVQDRVVVTMED